MTNISTHFKREEFACQCGCGGDTVDAEILETLEKIREHFGVPVTVTSGYRCAEHNKDIGGAPKSQHLLGRAADIQLPEVFPQDVARYARELGVSVGNYITFTHIDTRSGHPAHWG